MKCFRFNKEMMIQLTFRDELTFLDEELVDGNIGTSDEQRLVKVGAALPTPQ